MKKKIFIIIAFCFFVLVITGCDNKDEINKASITNKNTNEVEKLSAQKLIDIFKENSIKFEQAYSKTKIDVTDEVSKVSEAGMVVCVHLKNNWVIAYHRQTAGNPESFLKKSSILNAGDKVHFVGKIYKVGGYCNGNSSEVELNLTDDYILDVVK